MNSYSYLNAPEVFHKYEGNLLTRKNRDESDHRMPAESKEEAQRMPDAFISNTAGQAHNHIHRSSR